LYQVRVITVFTVFRLLTDCVCLYTYEFWLSLCKIVRSSVILSLPLLKSSTYYLSLLQYCWCCIACSVINVKIQKYTTDHSTLNKPILATLLHRPDWFPKHFNNTQCTLKNCIFSDEKTQLINSRVVLFSHRCLSKIIPKKTPNQLWIILDCESPLNDQPLPEM
jgi:hypothetical protein